MACRRCRQRLLLLGVAAFATLAQLAMTRAYSRGKTMMSAALAYSTVIFSSLFGMLFWGEVLGASAWTGHRPDHPLGYCRHAFFPRQPGGAGLIRSTGLDVVECGEYPFREVADDGVE
jgi:hypothetical protein